MAPHEALEAAKIVMEAADVAWAAMECCHHHNLYERKTPIDTDEGLDPGERELDAVRAENRRLRSLLEQNLKLLQSLSESLAVSENCPPDLYERLQSKINSKEFLGRLEFLNEASVTETRNQFPFKEPAEEDMKAVEVLITVDHKEPSWWVWVCDKNASSNGEEKSGIDDEHYVVVTDECVVDGIANFLAKCIVSNPKAQSLKPHELQKALSKGLEGMSKFEKTMFLWHAGKMFYTLSTWGLALFGLLQSREALKLAAKGAHTTGKVVYKGGKMVLKGTNYLR